MFTTTFYSYKGGVGRTLALANVAYVLAERDKKVLVVDFDLEAPGLTTLDIFKTARHKPGIIDYVNSYLENDKAPSLDRYIHTSKIKCGKGKNARTVEIDVMPAGCGDDTYAGQFAAIDWIKLYEERSGFLLIEELRESWRKRRYDYVLIDSRTGHTDAGGICTRQLPDLVVVVFFPNEQNLAGLRQITKAISERGARGKRIDLVYAASRIPKLDDEHGLLKGWLDRFQAELDYNQSDLTILEHYDSLALLNQTVFAIERPHSGLAVQYRKLAALISQHNMEDASGAFQFVRQLSKADRSNSQPDQLGDVNDDEILKRLISIASYHEHDCVIQYEVAKEFYSRRRIVECLVASDLSLAHVGKTKAPVTLNPNFRAGVHHLRLRAFTEIGSYEEVAETARSILSDPSASENFILDSILALANSDPKSLENIRDLGALKPAKPDVLADISFKLFASTSAVNVSAEVLEMALDGKTPWTPDHEDLVQSQLILIAGGKFDSAISLTERCFPAWRADLATAFNYGMAKWGADRRPSAELIEDIVPLFEGYLEAEAGNLHQCLALCHAILGQKRKMEASLNASEVAIRTMNRRQFSCWTYSNVPPADFEGHLDMIRQFGQGKGPPPEFLTRSWGIR